MPPPSTPSRAGPTRCAWNCTGTGIEAIILQPGPIHTRMLDNARGHFIETVDVRNSFFRGDYGREL